jgi:RNA polymerase sigma-70 factor (ECF subfamily)
VSEKSSDLNNREPANVGLSDALLAQQAAMGQVDARKVLFERYRATAFAVACRITRRNEDALDVVQDSFIKAFDRLDQLRGGAEFRSWFLRIVSNNALDLLRARKVRLAVPIEGPDDRDAGPTGVALADPTVDAPDADLESAELAQRLKRAVDQLPPQQRAVFSLYAAGEATYGQIAEALDIPVGTVMSRLYHARRKLQTALTDLAPRGSTG